MIMIITIYSSKVKNAYLFSVTSVFNEEILHIVKSIER